MEEGRKGKIKKFDRVKFIIIEDVNGGLLISSILYILYKTSIALEWSSGVFLMYNWYLVYSIIAHRTKEAQ